MTIRLIGYSLIAHHSIVKMLNRPSKLNRRSLQGSHLFSEVEGVRSFRRQYCSFFWTQLHEHVWRYKDEF
jgi:hypothetical protein